MLSDEVAEKAINYIRDNAERYGNAKARAEYLKESTKSIKALCMIDAERAGHKTLSAQEREAYNDPRYEAHLTGLREAIRESESLKIRLKAAELKFELWRTQAVNARREQDRYGT